MIGGARPAKLFWCILIPNRRISRNFSCYWSWRHFINY